MHPKTWALAHENENLLPVPVAVYFLCCNATYALAHHMLPRKYHNAYCPKRLYWERPGLKYLRALRLHKMQLGLSQGGVNVQKRAKV